MKKKYLFLTITEGYAGAEHVLVDYLRSIDYDQFSVNLGLRKDVFSAHLRENNLPVTVVSLPTIEPGDRFLRKFIKYFRFFNAVKPQCVVFNQYWLRSFTLAEVLAAFVITRGQVFMFVHDCPPVYPRYKGKLIFGILPNPDLSWRLCRLFQTLLGFFSKTTIAVSQASGDALKIVHKFPASKVKVVYHGVDVQRYAPSDNIKHALRQKLGLASSDIVIVSTAMLWPVKRIDRLVEAFHEVAQERKDIQLLIAGTGSEYGKLMNLTQAWQGDIGNRIRLLGYQDNIADLLRASDIYVLPSDSEGLPIACLEAMSCGLISIVTNCGGTTEIIRDGDNGFLVEKSQEGVTHGLRKALGLKPGEREWMSSRSRRFVDENFNLEKNIRSGLLALGLCRG